MTVVSLAPLGSPIFGRSQSIYTVHNILRNRLFLVLAFALFAIGGLRAQLPTVDITLVQTLEGPVEVRIRPDEPFDGLLSSIVFTVRWPDGQAGLGAVVQTLPVLQYCSVSPSGSMQVANGFRYQVFAGFGFLPLSSVPTAWSAGQEVVLCRINVVNGPGSFSIVNDNWTSDVNNNGNYFISLNGQDRTGEIYTISTTLSPEAPSADGPSIAPNPSDRLLTITMPEVQDRSVELRVVDAAGRSVMRQQLLFQGGAQAMLDISSLPAGPYVLHLLSGSDSSMHRIVVQH